MKGMGEMNNIQTICKKKAFDHRCGGPLVETLDFSYDLNKLDLQDHFSISYQRKGNK